MFKAGEGAGRSGSFFFFSHDNKFLIKTMTKGELTLFLSILPAYIDHFIKNPNSLLAKIWGVFTVISKTMHKVHIMVMENTLRLNNPEHLRYVFDLKGSTVDRFVSGATKPSTTLKDVNFVAACKQHDYLMKFPEAKKTRLKIGLAKDLEFLQKWNLMDYSLLLAIERRATARRPTDFQVNRVTQKTFAGNL